jgi:MFS family permease
MNQENMRQASAWLAFFIVSLFFLLEFIARIEPSLASTDIATWFGLSNSGFGTLSSIFFWIYAPMQLCVGLALDRYGPRRFVPAALLIMAAGIALFAWTDNTLIAGIGRFLTGLGASFGFVSGLYVVNHWFAPSRFALLSGAVNALGMLGTAIGAVALTSIIETSGWRSVFFVTSAACVPLAVLAAAGLKSTIVSPATSQPLFAPLITILSSPRILWIALLGALYYMPVNVYGGLWGNAELMAGHGLSSVNAETAISMIFWGMAIGSVAAGWLSDRLGHRKWIIASNAIFAAAAYTAAIYSASTSVVFLSALLFLGGLFGGAQMLTFAMAKECLPKAVSGTVIAFVNMVGIGGALVFQPLVGDLIDLNNGTYGLALISVPACLCASAIMILFVPQTRHEDHID